MGCVFLSATTDRLTLIGDDQAMRVVMTIPAKVMSDGFAAVPARIFLEMVSKLDAQQIRLKTSSGGGLAISAGGFRTVLLTPDAATYPGDDDPDYAAPIAIDGPELAAAIAHAGIAAAPANDNR